MKRRIAMAAGGTAGHVYPALALADAYRESFPDTEVLFLGAPNGFESVLIPERGYALETVHGAPLLRQRTGGKIRALGNLLLGTVQARRLLQAREMKLVIGFGGYASAGALLAGRSLGLGTAIHEANVTPGFANRWLGRIVDRIYLAFDQTRSAFPGSRTLVTGNPVRREILFARDKRTPVSIRPATRARILVTGGSGGSEFLNRNVPGLLRKVADRGLTLEVWHQAGEFSLESIRSAYHDARLAATVVNYVQEMAELYAWADFVIACAGSQTLSELSVCGLPCLLVPLSSAARDHQIENAIAFIEAKRGLWVSPQKWEVEFLASQIESLLRVDRTENEHLSAARPLREIDAAQRIVADCEHMMRGRW